MSTKVTLARRAEHVRFNLEKLIESKGGEDIARSLIVSTFKSSGKNFTFNESVIPVVENKEIKEVESPPENWEGFLEDHYSQRGTDPKIFIERYLERFAKLRILPTDPIMQVKRKNNKNTPEHTIKEAQRLVKLPNPIPKNFEIKLRNEVEELERRKALADKGQSWR
jgi:hypothetical protein